MTPPVIQRWIEIIDNGRTDELPELLADDATFYSPAVFSPQEGRAKTLVYLTAAVKLFGDKDFRYVGQWFGERSAVLEFEVDVDGIHVNGVDMIHWNDDDKIVEVKVMLRPFKALQAVMAAMAELLQSQ
ncbi:MAG TPA: nuclear transport factor 2 family protein [Mycobacterium sp.]|nr:nuclear transport factor 2 family protein [Mycobacterium sp.]